MKTRNFTIGLKGALSIGMFLIVTFLLQSCARKIGFTASSVVPAAEGSVKVKKDNNNNYNIDISLIRLAEPKRLDPPKEVYVVWMETEQNGTKNIGRLNTSSSLLSKTLKSSLTTVSSFKPTRIFITAENDAKIQYPGGVTVLNTNNF